MQNKNTIFNLSCSVQRAFGFYPLIISLILIYDNLFLEFLKIPPKFLYAIDFILFALAILYRNYSLIVSRWVYISLISVLLPLIVGIYNGWNIVDILADLFRYLAPFLGFAVGLVLLRRLKYIDILSFIYFLGFIHLCFYYYSVFIKILHISNGGSIINYAKYGLEVNFLFFLLFFFSF